MLLCFYFIIRHEKYILGYHKSNFSFSWKKIENSLVQSCNWLCVCCFLIHQLSFRLNMIFVPWWIVLPLKTLVPCMSHLMQNGWTSCHKLSSVKHIFYTFLLDFFFNVSWIEELQRWILNFTNEGKCKGLDQNTIDSHFLKWNIKRINNRLYFHSLEFLNWSLE